MILGVDVDLTIVDTGRAWYEYLAKQSEVKVPSYEEWFRLADTMPYDLTKVFSDLDLQQCLDYWRMESVYDAIMPMPNAIEVLEDLKFNKGYEIVFVSTIKGNHHKSKYYFLKRHFPFMDGFIATKEKKYARVDAMIDDRLNVLENMSNTITIHKQTHFDQSSSFKPAYAFNDWADFSKLAYRNF